MDNERELDEQIIGDIILCDPITRKGRNSLANLELTEKDITLEYFYKFLWVSSKYDENKEYDADEIDNLKDDNSLYYQYTADYEQFKSAQSRLKKFNRRFFSDLPDESPLLILGVAGNGKSIEVTRRIWNYTINSQTQMGNTYINLEYAISQKTYGETYSCPDPTNSQWLFCIKLLVSIMQYIKRCHSFSTIIFNNFNDIISKNNLANPKHHQLFRDIGNYCIDNQETETAVFRSLMSFTKSDSAEKVIQSLLEVLMLVMFCSAPKQKHYIVFDNIEEYIKLNDYEIQIHNSDITKIYQSIKMVVINAVDAFDEIQKNLGWKAFKIIFVLRRTSIGLLDPALLQSPIKSKLNINDITGYFQIPDIWAKKKKHIWEQRLKSKFINCDAETKIQLVDIIMNEGKQAVGTSYQSIIAPLMSYGIRRNARAQAHAVYKTYEILQDNSGTTINFEIFKKLLDAASSDNNSVRYMFRRALVEFQFKWAISCGNETRWKNLGIGHLGEEKRIIYKDKEIKVQKTDYDNPLCVTLFRRILTFLSCFPDNNTNLENGKRKSVIDMFSTMSLFDLMVGVFRDPAGKCHITDDDYLQLAKVLLALGNMSNDETKSAPFIILGVKDLNYQSNEHALKQLLKKIYSTGKEASAPGGQYNCSDFGARITDAGHSFLLDWQASYSFFASLYCYTIPSLFFLKDIICINYVIETVYNNAKEVCKKYENEAASFCGNNLSLKTGTYLPKPKNHFITFKERVKDLHIRHLVLYSQYLVNNYKILNIAEKDMLTLTNPNGGLIEQYIAKYNSWETEKGAPECF